jgi:endonuclease I
MNKLISIILLGTLSFGAAAQAPAGYYIDTAGLTGYALKTRLHQIIKIGHNDQGYSSLWNGYQQTDRDYFYENDGTLLDIYSENPNDNDPYNYVVTNNSDHCGNYNSEADCFNREHTIPQSLFNEAAPMKNDIQFVLPTDGYVNGKRNNFPYGKVNSPSWTSLNGSKLGPNATGTYTGTVFEPIDEFKGDIARILFYFATRYQDKIPNFSQGDILDGTTTRSLQQWQVDLLLEWHNQDPVSDKEISRNNAAFTYQGNRNPFIDHPQWVNCIWGNTNCATSTVDTGDVDSPNTSIRNSVLERSIELYPNPAYAHLSINSTADNKILNSKLLSIDGRVLATKEENWPAASIALNVSSLNTGMYFIYISTENGIVIKKFLKQ